MPVANEPFASPDEYSQDRLFVFLFLEGDDNEELEKRMKALQEAGHPVVRHDLVEKFDLGKEFFGWEIAVASAGSVIGIHPFNQPDVQLAKDFARKGGRRSPSFCHKASQSDRPYVFVTSAPRPGTIGDRG